MADRSLMKHGRKRAGSRACAASLLCVTALCTACAPVPAGADESEATSEAASSHEAPTLRVRGMVLAVGESASIQPCHAQPGQTQALEFSPSARAVIDRYKAAYWQTDGGQGDFPEFYLDGWVQPDGSGELVVQRVEAIAVEGLACDGILFEGGGYEPPWTVTLWQDHVALEVGYPDDRRTYRVDASAVAIGDGGYRWQSQSPPAITVTIEPGYCQSGAVDAVKMWTTTVRVPEDSAGTELIDCVVRGDAPLP